jgi:hypothetical protein
MLSPTVKNHRIDELMNVRISVVQYKRFVIIHHLNKIANNKFCKSATIKNLPGVVTMQLAHVTTIVCCAQIDQSINNNKKGSANEGSAFFI